MVVAGFTAKRRLLGPDQSDLELGPRGWICSEGERVCLDVVAPRYPIVRLAGLPLQPTTLRQTDEGFEGRYSIHIDTWAGRSVVELYTDERLIDSVTLDIRPSAVKLGQHEFDAMLDELAQRSDALAWGLSPGAGRGAERKTSPLVVHPVVVEALLPQFERLLARFIEDPPVRPIRERDLRRFDQSRRPDVSTLRWLSRRPAMLQALRGHGGPDVGGAARIDQPVIRASFDHPVTRYVAHLLRRIVVRFELGASELRRRRGRFADPAADALAESLATRLDAASSRIRRGLARPLFKSVTPEPASETVIQSLADHPLHAALHRVARRLLEPGLAYAPGGDLEAALKRTYDLFELLVLYRLVDEIPRQLGQGWRLTRAAALQYKGREARLADRASWWIRGPDQLSLELRYQQWFSRARHVEDERMFSSLSGPNVPDFILILRQAGAVLGWVILDAKYRASRQPVDQGLGDVHRYRDALRVRGMMAAGAFIIVPRLAESHAVYATSPYHDTRSFGALQLFETDWCRPILRSLGLFTAEHAG